MKKLTRKLFLSIAALACCAATLVSTTFAWYVNNPTAAVGSPTGSTMAAGADGSIMVSKDESTWVREITDLTANPRTELKPVKAAAGAATFTNLAGETVAQAAGAYLEFKFYVKSDVALSAETKKIQIQYTITNETTNHAGQRSFSNTGSGVEQGNMFVMDAVAALRMGFKIGDGAFTVYDVMAANKTTYASGLTAASGVTALQLTNTGAHDYYNALQEDDLTEEQKTELNSPSSATSMFITTANANTSIPVIFRVWLEGTDPQCYNSCAGQNFKFDLNLALVDAQ